MHLEFQTLAEMQGCDREVYHILSCGSQYFFFSIDVHSLTQPFPFHFPLYMFKSYIVRMKLFLSENI